MSDLPGNAAPQSAPAAPAAPQTPASDVGTRSFVVTWILSYVLGMLGVDRFYLGKIGTGVLKLVTFGGLGVWVLVDLILVLVGAQRDKQGMKLAGYDQHKKLAWIITAVVFVLGGIGSAINASTMMSSF